MHREPVELESSGVGVSGGAEAEARARRGTAEEHSAQLAYQLVMRPERQNELHLLFPLLVVDQHPLKAQQPLRFLLLLMLLMLLPARAAAAASTEATLQPAPFHRV